MSKKVVKNTKFNKPNVKVNKLDKNISKTITLVYTNEFKTYTEFLEKKIEDVDKKNTWCQ